MPSGTFPGQQFLEARPSAVPALREINLLGEPADKVHSHISIPGALDGELIVATSVSGWFLDGQWFECGSGFIPRLHFRLTFFSRAKPACLPHSNPWNSRGFHIVSCVSGRLGLLTVFFHSLTLVATFKFQELAPRAGRRNGTQPKRHEQNPALDPVSQPSSGWRGRPRCNYHDRGARQ